MRFVRAEELRVGMRLAQPIYNKKGVLLFGRDSRLSPQAIESVRNFGLLGVYVLDPAEPLPPMTKEDMEFERFQTMAIFSIQEELDKILVGGSRSRMASLAEMVIKSYGRLEGKITFHQNLRAREDFVYRHSLNTAILAAMISRRMNMSPKDQHQTVLAALVHDVGKVGLAPELLDGQELTGEERERIFGAQKKGLEGLDGALEDGAAIRRICTQAMAGAYELSGGRTPQFKMTAAAGALMVADRYDEMTVMHLGGSNDSEVNAVRELLSTGGYQKEAVKGLLSSVNILFPGVSIELSNGEKALVIRENVQDVLRPAVLCFSNNKILDLSRSENRKIQVRDILKSLDNRYIMKEIPPYQS